MVQSKCHCVTLISLASVSQKRRATSIEVNQAHIRNKMDKM